MFSNCGAEENSWEFLGEQGDQTSQSWRKSTLNIHWKDWCWSQNSSIWPPDAKDWLIEKNLMLGKIEGKRRRGKQRTKWLYNITDSMDMSSRRWWRTEKPGMLQSMVSQSWTRLSDWTKTTTQTYFYTKLLKHTHTQLSNQNEVPNSDTVR